MNSDPEHTHEFEIYFLSDHNFVVMFSGEVRWGREECVVSQFGFLFSFIFRLFFGARTMHNK